MEVLASTAVISLAILLSAVIIFGGGGFIVYIVSIFIAVYGDKVEDFFYNIISRGKL